MEWYEIYMWDHNPFEQSSAPEVISGFDDIRKELLGFIKSGEVPTSIVSVIVSAFSRLKKSAAILTDAPRPKLNLLSSLKSSI